MRSTACCPLRHDQRPDPVSEKGKCDADHSVAQPVRHHVAVGQESEAHLPLKEALGSDRQAGDGEDTGQRADDGHQLVHVKERGDQRCCRPDHAGDENSQGCGREECSTGMARLKRRALHQGRSHSELREVEGESDEHHRGAHDAEIRRCQKPGEENQHPQPQHGDGPAPPRDPRHAPDRTVRQARSGICHATPSNRAATRSLAFSDITGGLLLLQSGVKMRTRVTDNRSRRSSRSAVARRSRSERDPRAGCHRGDVAARPSGRPASGGSRS